MKMAHFQLEPGQAEESNTEAQTKAHKLQHLFAQLKPLIAGQGKVTVHLTPGPCHTSLTQTQPL